MNTVYPVPFICREQQQKRKNSQQGAVSVVMLCLLLACLFLGRSLCYFSWQGGEIIRQYKEEMQLRLAAESAVEAVFADLPRYEALLDSLADGQKRLLPENDNTLVAADMEIKTFALRQEGRIYLIACAFRRGGVQDDFLEKHCFAKVLIKKVEKNGQRYYKWMGWTA